MIDRLAKQMLLSLFLRLIFLLGICRGATILFPDSESDGAAGGSLAGMKFEGVTYVGPAKLKLDERKFSIRYRVSLTDSNDNDNSDEWVDVKVDFKEGGVPRRITVNEEIHIVIYDTNGNVKKVKCKQGCPDDAPDEISLRHLKSEDKDDEEEDDEEEDQEDEEDDDSEWEDLPISFGGNMDDALFSSSSRKRNLNPRRISCTKCEKTVSVVCSLSDALACATLGVVAGGGIGSAPGIGLACSTFGAVTCGFGLDATEICDSNLCTCDKEGNKRCTIGSNKGQCTECCGIFGDDECCPDGKTLRPSYQGSLTDPASNCCEGECTSGEFGSGKCCGPNSCVGANDCCPGQCQPFYEECCDDGTCAPKGCCQCGPDVCPETDACCPGWERCRDSTGKYSCHYIPDFYETPTCCGGVLYDKSNTNVVCCQTKSGSTLESTVDGCCEGSIKCGDGCASTRFLQAPACCVTDCCGGEAYDTACGSNNKRGECTSSRVTYIPC